MRMDAQRFIKLRRQYAATFLAARIAALNKKRDFEFIEEQAETAGYNLEAYLAEMAVDQANAFMEVLERSEDAEAQADAEGLVEEAELTRERDRALADPDPEPTVRAADAP